METPVYAILLLLAVASVNCQAREKYRVALGADFGGYDYINKEGYVAGFYKDMVDAVCAAGNLDCYLVWDKYSNCLYSTPGQHLQGGKGIMGDWYDVCAGWFPTVTRMQIFQFTQPFVGLDQHGDIFWKKTGSSFDPNNIEGKIIGFLDGWWNDEKCLVRNEKSVGGRAKSVKIFQYVQQLHDAISNGDVDAGFTGYGTMQNQLTGGTIERAAPKKMVQCALAGPAMFTRKGSKFVGLWNNAFAKLRANGGYKKVCDKATDNHGHKGPIVCLQS